jgi:hypothetical protein
MTNNMVFNRIPILHLNLKFVKIYLIIRWNSLLRGLPWFLDPPTIGEDTAGDQTFPEMQATRSKYISPI